MQGPDRAFDDRPSTETLRRRRTTLELPTSETVLVGSDERPRPYALVHVDDGGRYETELGVESAEALGAAAATCADDRLTVVLKPELSDLDDPNAVAVYLAGGRRLGAIDGDESALWQPLLLRLFRSCEVLVACQADVYGVATRHLRMDVTLKTIRSLLESLQRASDDRVARLAL